MKARCPGCGASMSLEVLLANEATRDVWLAAFKLAGPIGQALVRYLTLFRPSQRELSMDRAAKLLGELLPDLQAQRISRDGVVYEAPLDAWVWAIDQALTARDAGRLKLPLKGHGWLYEVISNWRPQAGQLVGDGEARPVSVTKPSQTLAGVAALEQFKRGA